MKTSNIIYIDPEECSSTIGYTIKADTYFEANIDLADCNHKIAWSFSDDTGVEKVDLAIEILLEFRSAYTKASALFKKQELQRKKEKENAKK